MLQQTRVDTVIRYYNAFLEAFPSFFELAAAKEEDVLNLWQGLGYYSRARNLYATARKVVEEHGGKLPSSLEELRMLPGVGEYMSNAIMAIAFDQPFVAVDGNLLRVYARLEAKRIDPTSAQAKKECRSYFLRRIKSPSAFNQALMDLGELVCLPNGNPKCEQCPFALQCKARKSGNPLEFPVSKKKTASHQQDLTIILLQNKAGDIAVRKRPAQGLLAAMHEFPNVEGRLSQKEIQSKFPQIESIRFLGRAKHKFSHIRWDMDVYAAVGEMSEYEYVPMAELGKRCNLPTAFSKLLKMLQIKEEN